MRQREERKTISQAITLILAFLAIAACGVVMEPAHASTASTAPQAQSGETKTVLYDALMEMRPSFRVEPRRALEQTLSLVGAIDATAGVIKPDLMILSGKDPRGAALYQDISLLLWNSGPVSAGALYLAATTKQQRTQDARWKVLGNALGGVFGDAALTSSSRRDLDDLKALRLHAANATKALSGLDRNTSVYGRLLVLGALWDDPVAQRAGELGLALHKASPRDMTMIRGLIAKSVDQRARLAQQPGRYLPHPVRN